MPFTEPVAAVTTAFTAALASSSQLPRPVPAHCDDACVLLQPQQAGAVKAATAAAAAGATVPFGASSSKAALSAAADGSAAAAARGGAAPAACDTQYGLLQLHARGSYGLGQALLDSGLSGGGAPGVGGVGGQLARLLRVAGHVINPLDYSTAWQLLQLLDSVGALPARREECELQGACGACLACLWAAWAMSQHAHGVRPAAC